MAEKGRGLGDTGGSRCPEGARAAPMSLERVSAERVGGLLKGTGKDLGREGNGVPEESRERMGLSNVRRGLRVIG